MKTTSKTLQYRQKKEKNRLTGSSQVYGRSSGWKTTNIGHLANATCTPMHLVVASFTTSHDSPWNNRARAVRP